MASDRLTRKTASRVLALAIARQALPKLDDTALAINGLSEREVRERIDAGLTNQLPRNSSRSLAHIVRANLFTLFNGVVGGSFVLLLILGQWHDALFGFFVIANVSIGVVQEFRAKRTLDKLAVVNAPYARVLRAGNIREIALERVVYDDVLVLRAGDQVSADAVILGSKGMQIDESLLTGESDPIDSSSGDTVLSGSTVISGHGEARVVRVGAESFANQLTAEAKRYSLVNSELRNSLNRIVRWISWALIPLIALITNGQMQAAGGWDEAIRTGSWRQAAVSAVASIISMIPQGLVFITSVAFAVGAVRLARNQVLVQELPAVEGLARVDIVCFDKTGTLTEGEIIFDEAHEVGALPVSDWQRVLAYFGADVNANATARCLRTPFADTGGLSQLSAVDFSSLRKWSAASFDADAAQGTWVLGAPELILRDTNERDANVLRKASALAASGLRVLLLAYAPQPMTVQDAALERLPNNLSPAVIVTFREEVRSDAARTLAYFRKQGVGVRLLSGDNPQTVAAVARRVGMDFDGDGYDARNLPSDKEQLAEILEQHQVFGRVTPEQKKDMICALQHRGHVVAMTGDGVNDVLAVKTADLGVAMGTGAAATKAVSRLVLLDGKFSRLPDLVAEGRRVIANVERVSNLFLTKTVYAIILAVVFGALLWRFPFLPRQLSAVDGLTIGIPALFLALPPNPHRYRGGFLKRTLRFCIPAGVIIGVAVTGTVGYAQITGNYSQNAQQTAALITLALMALWVLAIFTRPFNRWRMLLLATMYLGLVGCLIVPFSREFFGFTVLPTELLTIAIFAAALGCIALEILHQKLKKTISFGIKQ